MATGTQPITLDAPLPVELAGRHQGWFTRYRRWPVFSGPWVRGRLASVGSMMVVTFGVLVVPAFIGVTSDGRPVPLGGMAQIALDFFAPLLLGPWLAMQVRRRGWPARREWIGVVGAVALTVLLMLGFRETLAEPMKQWIAEQQGAVDASGKRKRMIMSFGFYVSDPERRDRLPDPREDPSVRLVSALAFGSLHFLLAGGLALGGWRREQRELAALARERELAQAQAARREAELRLSVLAAQVEPHFLFNTLAGVRSAIATDPARASEMIDRLVDYLRAAIPRLRSDGRVQATLGAQIEVVRAYLGLMAARMPRLKWRIDAPAELLTARCPPLMLISLAENAVKHGVERKIGPALVELRAARGDDGRLHVSVLDDGAGFQPTGSGSGLGLANIRERLAQLHPGRAELRLQARPEGGVAATLVLPLEFDDPSKD